MRRRIVLFCIAILLFGGVKVKAEEASLWDSVLLRMYMQRELEGEEIWRKELGRERCLLLYIDETGEEQMVFTDGVWIYLTDGFVGRIKEMGMRLWEREKTT